jgi:hypothetical protein
MPQCVVLSISGVGSHKETCTALYVKVAQYHPIKAFQHQDDTQTTLSHQHRLDSQFTQNRISEIGFL